MRPNECFCNAGWQGERCDHGTLCSCKVRPSPLGIFSVLCVIARAKVSKYPTMQLSSHKDTAIGVYSGNFPSERESMHYSTCNKKLEVSGWVAKVSVSQHLKYYGSYSGI